MTSAEIIEKLNNGKYKGCEVLHAGTPISTGQTLLNDYTNLSHNQALVNKLINLGTIDFLGYTPVTAPIFIKHGWNFQDTTTFKNLSDAQQSRVLQSAHNRKYSNSLWKTNHDAGDAPVVWSNKAQLLKQVMDLDAETIYYYLYINNKWYFMYETNDLKHVKLASLSNVVAYYAKFVQTHQAYE